MMPRAASAGGKVKDEPLSPGGGNDRKVGEEEREERRERKGEERRGTDDAWFPGVSSFFPDAIIE